MLPMGTMNIEAPSVPTYWNTGGEYKDNIVPEMLYDPITVQLRDSLNAQVQYPPTMQQPTFPVYVRAYDNGPGDSVYTPSGLGDSMFSGRWGAMNWNPKYENMIARHEASEIPYGHLAYAELLHNSTIPYNQSAPGRQITMSLRAPGINEGL